MSIMLCCLGNENVHGKWNLLLSNDSDIVSGVITALARLEQDELLQLGVQLDKQGIALTETLDEKEEREVVSTVLGEPLQPDDPLNDADDPTFPPDPSPPAVLPGGSATADLLTDIEREVWEASGQPTEGYETGEWGRLAALDGREYWSVFERPVYVDGSVMTKKLPRFNESADGMAVSFWFKPIRWVRAYGPHFRMLHGPQLATFSCDGSEETSEFSMRVQLDWVTMEMRAGTGCARDWRYLTYFDKETGRVRETFLLSAFAEEVSPVTWRHLLYHYDGVTGRLQFYLDGKLAVDTGDPVPSYGTGFHREFEPPFKPVADIFSNMTVVPHSFGNGGSYLTIPGKMAQLRMIPHRLTAAEVLRLHDHAVWPDATAVKQCIDPLVDEGYADTTSLDARRQPCAWYYRMQLRYPYICRLKWLKAMCPVICSGERLCHDGKVSASYTPPPSPKTYWLFDRILYLKPKREGQTILCRSSDLDVQAVLDTCEAVNLEIAKGDESNLGALDQGAVDEYLSLLGRLFDKVLRADVMNCTLLRELLEDQQPCTFNTSWMPEFAKEFNRTRTWSLTFWLRPKPGSLGTPTNFWFAVKFFARLSPPILLNHWHEVRPDLEPWLDAYTLYADSSGGVSRVRAEIWPTTTVDYSSSWTFYHFQVQHLDDGTFRLCGSINALPMDCVTETGSMLADPSQLIQAVEFTTEMLVSPIQVTTEWYTRAQIQLNYYRKVADMGRVLGPMVATHERAAGDEQATDTAHAQAEVDGFDQRVALLAPPLIFQTRAKREACTRKVTTTFLEGQVELKRAALCQGGRNCEWVTAEAIATCFDRGQDENQQYWGNPARSRGFSEFLYVVDSPNVVRPNLDGENSVVQTRDFLDGLTTSASVLAVFHSPNTGLTTAVELSADVASPEIKTSVAFLHLGFVDEAKLPEMTAAYTCLLLVIVVHMIDGVVMLRRYRADRHRHGCPYKLEIADYSADIVQGVLVMAFSVFSLVRAVTSQSNIEDIVGQIREVSWIDPDVTFTATVDQFFAAVDNFRYQLEIQNAINTIAVIILFVLLFRIFAGTAMHPHTGVLVGTVMTAFLDLHHFFILFMLINCLFAFTATWVFGPERIDFQDFRTSLNTQFSMLLGMDLPEGYDEDPLLVAYVVSCTVIIFFFMLNFLLAVVVEGYMKVREQIQLNEAEFEFFTDLFFTLEAKVKGVMNNWPRKRDLAVKLRRMFVKRICATHLRVQGLDVKGTVDMFNHYARYKALQCAPPEWKGAFYNYDRTDHLSVQSFQRMMNSVEHIRSSMTALQDRLGVQTTIPSPHQSHLQQKTGKHKKSLTMLGGSPGLGVVRNGSTETSQHGKSGSVEQSRSRSPLPRPAPTIDPERVDAARVSNLSSSSWKWKAPRVNGTAVSKASRLSMRRQRTAHANGGVKKGVGHSPAGPGRRRGSTGGQQAAAAAHTPSPLDAVEALLGSSGP